MLRATIYDRRLLVSAEILLIRSDFCVHAKLDEFRRLPFHDDPHWGQVVIDLIQSETMPMPASRSGKRMAAVPPVVRVVPVRIVALSRHPR